MIGILIKLSEPQSFAGSVSGSLLCPCVAQVSACHALSCPKPRRMFKRLKRLSYLPEAYALSTLHVPVYPATSESPSRVVKSNLQAAIRILAANASFGAKLGSKVEITDG